jgi:hypothetical protein
VLLTAITETRYVVHIHQGGRITLELLKNTNKHENAKLSLSMGLKSKQKQPRDKLADLGAYIDQKLSSRDFHLVMVPGNGLAQRLLPTAPSPLYNKWGNCAAEDTCDNSCNYCAQS